MEELLGLRENEALSDEEHAELMQIIEAREADNVERVSVVGRLAEMRGMKFQALWKELGLISETAVGLQADGERNYRRCSGKPCICLT